MKKALRVLAVFSFLLVATAARADRPGVEVERSPGSGRIRALRGELSPPSPEAPRAIAERFLSGQAGRFGMKAGLTDLRLARAVESPAGRHFRFEQTFRGLPVFDAGVEVHVATDGRVFLAHNDYAAGIDLPVSPSRAPADVIPVAVQDFLKTCSSPIDKKGRSRPYRGEKLTLGREIVPELGVFAGASPARLAYRLVVFAESPFGVVEYIVDAHTGEILRKRSLVQDAHLTGRGQVFDPNPVNTLNDMSLRDLGNSNDPAFTPAYRTVALPGVSRWFFDIFGAMILSGPYVKINDFIEAPFYNQPFSFTGDFIYTRDRQEFEDVMVYFHIDRTQRYIQSLGFTTVNNRMIRVDPHGLNGADNSHYVGFPFGMGWIAFGEGGVDDAEDADVIWHEYGHAMQDNTTMGKYFGLGESGAQGEGFGDYWAFSNGPAEGFDPACLAEWDFAGTCLRRLDSTKHYPEDIVHEVHDDGEIWSSALRDLFLALGKETTDRIVLQSHFLVPFFPRFCDGARALRDADDILYGGANGPAIGTTVAAHGIAADLAALNPAVTRAEFPTADLHFEITNQGPCAAGAAAHSVRLICAASGDLGEVATVETADLLRGESAAFDLTLPSRRESCFYRVLADAGGAEFEAIENNNVADSPAFTPPPLVADFHAEPVTSDPAVYFEKASASGDRVMVSLKLRSSSLIDFDAFTMEILFDPSLVQFTGIDGSNTPFGACSAAPCGPLCLSAVGSPGDLLIGVTALGTCPSASVSGDITLLAIGFAATAPGSSPIRFVQGPGRGDCEILNDLVDLGIPCLDGNATITAE